MFQVPCGHFCIGSFSPKKVGSPCPFDCATRILVQDKSGKPVPFSSLFGISYSVHIKNIAKKRNKR